MVSVRRRSLLGGGRLLGLNQRAAPNGPVASKTSWYEVTQQLSFSIRVLDIVYDNPKMVLNSDINNIIGFTK